MSSQPVLSANVELDPARWVELYGDMLFRYAVKRLGDRHVAENVVQETFLAALRAQQRFQGDASERTWLTGILKHKIVDVLRSRSREHTSTDDEDLEATLFTEKGGWRTDLAGPSAELERRDLRDVIQRCLSRLPGRLAEAFVLREVAELDVPEVSEQLGITQGNLAVMLHRARLRLRTCIVNEDRSDECAAC